MVTRIGAVRGESCALALDEYMVGWRTIVQRVSTDQIVEIPWVSLRSETIVN